ncbi:MAG: NAD(P)-binding domain-containing protein [Spirochaeta sp.]|nr:NAD(P)-binding domain-containing protein [Spirochaeta sp.]
MKRDVILVGAGPVGIEMAAVLKRSGLSVHHIEAGPIGATITRWPRNTRFFSSPEWIAIAGIPIQTAGQEIVTGEDYLAYLRQVVEILDLEINTYQTVDGISGKRGAFTVSATTLAGEMVAYEGSRLVFATGDMNFVRPLEIPGENLPHVTHLWSDPHLYFRKKLLIVGGRNSAVEAAIRSWRAGADVTISYRGDALDEKRLISRLWLETDLLIKNGQIQFLPRTVPVAIGPGSVTLRRTGGGTGGDSPADPFDVAADFVYLATGFTMDRRLYEMCGISMEGTERQPHVDTATMESDAPGVYVVGTACGGDQHGYSVFITTSHEHCLKAARSIAADLAPTASIEDGWVGNLPARDYPLSSGDVE